MTTRNELKLIADRQYKQLLDKILKECCKVTGIKKSVVLSRCRNREIMNCRKLFCFFAYGYTVVPMPFIESYIGLKHATILAHHKGANELIFDVGDIFFSQLYQTFNAKILKELEVKV